MTLSENSLVVTKGSQEPSVVTNGNQGPSEIPAPQEIAIGTHFYVQHLLNYPYPCTFYLEESLGRYS